MEWKVRIDKKNLYISVPVEIENMLNDLFGKKGYICGIGWNTTSEKE